MGFSDFQTRQLYVANSCKDAYADLADPGDICVGKGLEDEFYLIQVGALGHKNRSDMIGTPTVTVTATSSDDDVVVLKGYSITLNPDVNDGTPILGADYSINVRFTNFIGLGDSNTYDKFGRLIAGPDMSASDFYKEMAYSLVLNAKKDPSQLYCVYLVIGGEETLVDKKMTFKQVSELGDADCIHIYEAAQRWERARFPQSRLPFTLMPIAVHLDGVPVPWALIEELDSDKTLPQGQRVADLEFHCISERGDIYYGVGWPDAIVTHCLVDPKKEYDIINIDYYWTGTLEAVQKSQKMIQIACLNEGSHDVANALIGKINEATGLSVETL